jgi:hypothetical protein
VSDWRDGLRRNKIPQRYGGVSRVRPVDDALPVYREDVAQFELGGEFFAFTPAFLDAIVAGTKGWCPPSQGRALWDWVQHATHNVPYGASCELGVWKGLSTTYLGWALCWSETERMILYAVDSFRDPRERTEDEARRNLTRAGLLPSIVELIAEPSIDAAPQIPDDLAFLHVDAGHSYKQVRRDLDVYLPKVARGGIVVLDDVIAGYPGIVRAIEETLDVNPAWTFIGRQDAACAWERI